MEDILIAENFELQLVNGMLVRGESTQQHQHLLLITNKGDWRFTPLVGVGVLGYLKDEDHGRLLPEIKQQFERDGMKVTDVKLVKSKIIIDANYKNG